MTAIIGYINKKEESSVGVLVADNLEGVSKTKVDKLVKLSDRFVIGVVGLEVVQWAMNYTIVHLEMFKSSKVTIDSISSLETLLTNLFSKTFKEWKANKVVQNISEQTDIESQLVVLDTFDRKLYHAELGEVWKIDERQDFAVSFTELPQGLYTFGVVVPLQAGRYQKEEYSEFEKDKIFDDLKLKFDKFNSSHTTTVGQLGSMQITLAGKVEHESFKSCYDSYEDALYNVTKRHATQ